MKIFFILSAMLIVHFTLVSTEQKVIDSAANSTHALVVSAQTVKSIKLDRNEMGQYFETLQKSSGNILDLTMFFEIIVNAGSLDTIAWKDKELKNLLVVQNRDEEIEKNYLIEKMNLSGKKQLRFYSRQINKYNETDPSVRNIYSFSRPVYSHSGKYAVIQWDNARNGGINLYHLAGSKWIEVGTIKQWNN